MDVNDNINGGTIFYEDAVKKDVGGDPQFWPTKRAKVELRFEVFEGEPGLDVADTVSELCREKVSAMLGTVFAPTKVVNITQLTPEQLDVKTKGKRKIAETKTLLLPGQVEVPSVLAEPDVASLIVNPPVVVSVEPLGEPAPPAADASITSASATVASTGSPQAIPGLPGSSPPSDASLVTNDLADILGPPADITDASLGAAVTRRNKELGATGAVKIRALLNTFNPEPETRVFQLRELTQPQRQTFLDSLAELAAD